MTDSVLPSADGPVADPPAIVRRAFADLDGRQVHYRHAGSGRPILLLHAGPGSARQLTPLIAALGDAFHAIAPDMPGNGDSDPLRLPAPTIADHAAAELSFLDVLGIDRIDVYGSHTGAAIAAELAIVAPHRIGRVVMDGLGVFDAVQRDAMLAHYAHAFTPDLDGAYLMRAFHFLRDQYLFFPWYDRSAAAWRGSSLPPAHALHDWLVEVLKAAETYPLAYRASLMWDAEQRLPLVKRPTLMTAAANDPLFDGTRGAASLLADGRFVALPRLDDPACGATRAATVRSFVLSA